MILATLTLALAAGGGSPSDLVTDSPASARPVPVKSRRPEPFGDFVENKGQWPAEALFVARAGGVQATVLQDGFVLWPLPAHDAEGNAVRPTEPLAVRFAGAAGEAEVSGLEPGPTKHHFIHALGSAQGALGYARVVYASAWPGVDLVLRRDGDAFAYDLHVQPGADLDAVELELVGATEAGLVGGQLVLATPEGPLEHRFGAAWEIDEAGARVPVEPRAVLRGMSADGAIRLGYAVHGRDPSRPLVIDPTFSWGTFIDGSDIESVPCVAVGADGSTYVTLWLFAGAALPTTTGTLSPSAPGGTDIWVGKLSADGSTLVWGTYLGGTESDRAPEGIAVDADGSLVVMGDTFSVDFPTTPGVVQPTKLGNSDLYVSRLAPDGSTLVWSTYLGCLDYDTPQSNISLFDDGDVLIEWGTWTGVVPNLPPGGYDAVYDFGDNLVVRLASDGSAIVAKTWIAIQNALATAIDGDSNVYLTGNVYDIPAPTTPTAHEPTPPTALGTTAMGYAASLTPDLGQLRYGTYLGGSKLFGVRGAAVDTAGCLYVTAACASANSPVTPGAFQSTIPTGKTVVYVAKLLPHGTGLAWGTFLGAWPMQGGGGFTSDLVVDPGGRATVCGASNGGWPVTPDALQPVISAPLKYDAAFAQFDAVGEQLEYSTWFGGTGVDTFDQIASGPAGSLTLVLTTSSPNLHVTTGAYDTTYSGSQDIAVATFDPGISPWTVLGDGLKGGVETPNLVGLGANGPGSPTRIALRGALPTVPAFVVAGTSEVYLPILGGTLVPSPDFVLPIATNALGWRDVAFSWPGFTPGQLVAFQAWCFDPGAPQGWSASNGLRAIAQ